MPACEHCRGQAWNLVVRGATGMELSELKTTNKLCSNRPIYATCTIEMLGGIPRTKGKRAEAGLGCRCGWAAAG